MSAYDKDGNTFAQVSALLIEYGLLEKPLDLSNVDKGQYKILSDVLHALIAQRQRDADLRQELVSRNRTLENGLERTKKLWQEDGDKCADAERKLESAKSAANTSQQQYEQATSTLKRTRDELHRTRKDLVSVKQQAVQQRQANERQIERTRARFTEEAMKSLRTRLPQVDLCVTSSSRDKTDNVRDASSVQLLSRLARRQIDELEQRKNELANDNLTLKSLAVDCLNLARSAGSCLVELTREQEKSAFTGSTAMNMGSLSCDEVFSTEGPILRQDGTMESATKAFAETSECITKSIDSLRRGRSDRLWSKGQDIRRQFRESVIEPLQDDDKVDVAEDRQTKQQAMDEAEELRCMLDRAIGQIEDLEEKIQAQKREIDRAVAQESKQSSTPEVRSAMAEVERQRQRYQSLCRTLEEQERAIAYELDMLQQQQEELALEHSLLATDRSVSAVSEQYSIVGPIVSNDAGAGNESDSSNVTVTSTLLQPQSRLIPQRFASTPRTRILPILSASAAVTAAKRPLTDEKENKESNAGASIDGKRQRIASNKSEKTGTQVIGGTEMRFITMRKNRDAR